MGNRAEIEIGARDNASKKIDDVKRSVAELGGEIRKNKLNTIIGDSQKDFNAAGKVVDTLKETLKGAYRAATDFSRAANDIKPLNFGAAADRAKAFDDTLTRMSIRSGKGVDTLRGTFVGLSKEIGVMPERVANATRALNRLTYGNDAENAMKALGDEANDTDRSIEDMIPLGEALNNKLGVPAQRVAGELLKIKNIAVDLQTVGGRVALEDTLVRLSPLLARVAGGARHHAAIVGQLGKGKSKEVAEEEAGAIYGAIAGADPLLVTKALRQQTGNRKYQAYERDPFSGRVQLKAEALPLLQKKFKNAPGGKAALTRLLGNNVGAAEALWDLDFDEIEKLEFGEAGQRAKKRGLPAERRVFDLDKPLSEEDKKEIDTLAGGPVSGQKSIYSKTASGQRATIDQEKGEVELKVGGYVQKLRDQRDKSYEGHRGEQAATDTALQYLPSGIANALSIGDAALSAGRQEISGDAFDRKRLDKIEVDLSPKSIDKLSNSLRQQTVPTPGPAAQAVEANKAAGRAAANY